MTFCYDIIDLTLFISRGVNVSVLDKLVVLWKLLVVLVHYTLCTTDTLRKSHTTLTQFLSGSLDWIKIFSSLDPNAVY